MYPYFPIKRAMLYLAFTPQFMFLGFVFTAEIDRVFCLRTLFTQPIVAKSICISEARYTMANSGAEEPGAI
jgi:hypothetical protein